MPTRIEFFPMALILSLLLPHRVLSGEVRVWTSRSGKHKVKAEFIDYKDGVIILRRDDTTLRVSGNDFIDADQEYAKQQSRFATNLDAKTVSSDPNDEANELLERISKLRSAKIPPNLNKQQTIEFVLKASGGIIVAADTIRARTDVDSKQLSIAMSSKLSALNTIGQILPSRVIPRIDEFQHELDRPELENLKRPAKSIGLLLELRSAKDKQDAANAIRKTMSYLNSLGTLMDLEIQLGQRAARLSEIITDYSLASKTHEELIKLIPKDPKYGRLIAGLSGSASRFRLVGNEMKITGVSLDGTQFDFSDLKGRVVLVDFWATWCGPCLQEMSNIQQNYRKYHDKGFEVVAISVDKDLGALSSFLSTHHLPWTILADYHPKNPKRLNASYAITAIPTTILLQDGKVVSLNCRGPLLEKELAERLGSL